MLFAAHLFFKIPGHFFYFCCLAYDGDGERVFVGLIHFSFELLGELQQGGRVSFELRLVCLLRGQRRRGYCRFGCCRRLVSLRLLEFLVCAWSSGGRLA